MAEIDRKQEAQRGPGPSEAEKPKPSVLCIHAKLSMEKLDADYLDVLHKYGRVKEEISRDILIPADMTLHTLHFVLQKAFGWWNSHIHRFLICHDDFNRITRGTAPEEIQEDYIFYDGSFLRWAALCGSYFRFPFDDTDDYDWDEDFEGETRISTWLKKKYTNPEPFGGLKEHFMPAKKALEQFIRENPILLISPLSKGESIYYASFHPYSRSKKPEEQKVPLHELTIDEFNHFLSGEANEVLERLPVWQILFPIYEHGPSLKELERAGEQAAFLYEKYEGSYDQEGRPLEDALFARPGIPFSEEMEDLPPITSLLHYEYDFGDGWRVDLTLREAYHVEAQSPLKVSDHQGHVLKPVRAGQVARVQSTGCPVCIHLDGLSVFDDAGGINEYADFLENLFEYEDSEQLEWATDKGWSPRPIPPGKLL